MTTEPAQVDRTEAHLRARRLTQIAGLTMAGLAALSARAVSHGQPGTAVIMGLGVLVMLSCLVLNRLGSTASANLLLIVSLGICILFYIKNTIDQYKRMVAIIFGKDIEVTIVDFL